MKVAFYTLGCKVNQNETGALQAMFRAAGHTLAGDGEPADIYIVNSCTVTAGGDAKSRRWLHRAKRQNPAAITVLAGCWPQAFPQSAAGAGADIVTGTAQRGRLLAQIERFMAEKSPFVDITPYQKDDTFEELAAAPMPGRTRAFVKVQDGCNRRCSYCIIPTARGPSRSRAEAAILAELARMAAEGHAEVVFTGINLPSYGRDTGTTLARLAQAAAGVDGIRRIRLSSLDPDLLSDEDIALFAKNDKLCPHFHLSLQSGCTETLRRMRRPYTAAAYAETAAKLRAAFPAASFTTDVIVGFPGETEAGFEESLAFVRQMEFLKVHVFPFSARPGTPAADMEGQISKEEKARRAHVMQQAADVVRDAWIAARQGTRHTVLLETPDKLGNFTGYTENYIPVALVSDAVPGAKQGDIVPVVLGAWDGSRCLCNL